MKIRYGFVSNSSSSSFIVCFDEKPNTVEELEEMMFSVYPQHYYYDDVYNTREIAERVFSEMKRQVSDEKIKKELLRGYICHPYEDKDYNVFEKHAKIEFLQKHPDLTEEDLLKSQEFSDIVYKMYKRDKEKNIKKLLQMVNLYKYKYLFHYSDNNGKYDDMLEHSGIFAKLFHIVISHH